MVLISAGNYLISFKSPPTPEGLAVAGSLVFSWWTCWAHQLWWEALQSPTALCMTPLRWITKAQCQEITVIAEGPKEKPCASWSMTLCSFQMHRALPIQCPKSPLPLPVSGSLLCPGEGRQDTAPCALYPFGAIDTANDKNDSDFKDRLGRFTKGCLEEGNHTHLRRALAARLHPGQVGIFCIFLQEFTLTVAREAQDTATNRKAITFQSTCELLGLITPRLCLPMAALNGNRSLSFCSLDFPASHLEQSESAAWTAAGSTNSGSRTFSFSSNSKGCSLNFSLSTGWCVFLTDKNTGCESFPCWIHQEFTLSHGWGAFLAIPHLSIAKE